MTNSKVEFKELIERFKVKADRFIRDSQKAYIRDMKNIFYFCYILKYDDDAIYIRTFEGLNPGQNFKIFWEDIIRFKEYGVE